MVAPTPTDEQKLNSLKQNAQRRPVDIAPVPQPSSQQTRESNPPTNIPTGGSSDDVDSLFDQSTNYTGRTSRSPSSSIIANTNGKSQERSSSLQKSTDSLSTVHTENNADDIDDNNTRTVDCESVTSSEWGADDAKSEKDGSIFQRHNASTKRKLKKTSIAFY
jgi:hypothetical protein